eukprot:scaffold300074_cov18-Prasinocladus_malaysianus.AAC.1
MRRLQHLAVLLKQLLSLFEVLLIQVLAPNMQGFGFWRANRRKRLTKVHSFQSTEYEVMSKKQSKPVNGDHEVLEEKEDLYTLVLNIQREISEVRNALKTRQQVNDMT